MVQILYKNFMLNELSYIRYMFAVLQQNHYRIFSYFPLKSTVF